MTSTLHGPATGSIPSASYATTVPCDAPSTADPEPVRKDDLTAVEDEPHREDGGEGTSAGSPPGPDRPRKQPQTLATAEQLGAGAVHPPPDDDHGVDGRTTRVEVVQRRAGR